MEPDHLDILREAVGKRQRKETIERSLGQAVRAAGKDFSVYISIIGEVREFAQKHKLSELDAAVELLREGDDQAQDD
jgi:hypothetical protein